MLESPFYREILEEGKELGQEEGLRESVLDVLEVWFGLVPPNVEERVRLARGRRLLEGLHRRAILVESLEAFGEALSKVQALSAGQQSSVR